MTHLQNQLSSTHDSNNKSRQQHRCEWDSNHCD
jgi:hypothetical protein